MGYGLTGTPASFPFQSHVEFIVNAPYATVLSWLGKASIGLSTMVDEHFGINIVEYMVRPGCRLMMLLFTCGWLPIDRLQV